MKSGLTLREELTANLKLGISDRFFIRNIRLWKSIRHKIDSRRFAEVMESLLKERRDAETYYNVAIHFFDLYK